MRFFLVGLSIEMSTVSLEQTNTPVLIEASISILSRAELLNTWNLVKQCTFSKRSESSLTMERH